MRRHPGNSPFLLTPDRSWSYSEAVSEVEHRLTERLTVVDPSLTPGSVFDVLAGVSGGGLFVLDGTAEEPTDLTPVPGARMVVFTSGTTGPPRGVRLTAANLEAASSASAAHLGHGPGDCWLLAMSLRHVGGLSVILRSAYAGGSISMLPGFDPAGFAAALRNGVTVASVVAAMLSRVLDVDAASFTGLRGVLVGGGPVPTGLLERAHGRGIPALPTYGMTETFGQVATLRPGSAPAYRVDPLPGIEIRIDPDGRIAVAGDQVSPGYLGEPDRAGRWLVTSDLGELDASGSLRVLGRADSVIVTGGMKVDPARVEAELEVLPEAGEVVVFPVADPVWGQIVVCGYTGEGDPNGFESWLRGRLAAHMVPKRWVRMVEVPRTSLGKPDRAAAARASGL